MMAKKGKSFNAPKGGGRADMSSMLSKLQKLQEGMESVQNSLADEYLDVTAGGGAITITISGQQRIKAIKLDAGVVDPNDLEMLQDLIVAAVNEAIERSQVYAAQKLQGLTGDLGLPPIQ
jgi:DNA-binding YbaB/EbfC family protein